MARERVTRALTAARLTADGHTPAQVAAALGCSIETVGNLIADGGFYEAPAGDQRRLELARAAAVMLATGKTRAQVISALAGSGAHRAVRDAGALTILNRLDES
ncbi:MAG: helix-turn-helix domain-containing protein [Cellulomonas sp.]